MLPILIHRHIQWAIVPFFIGIGHLRFGFSTFILSVGFVSLLVGDLSKSANKLQRTWQICGAVLVLPLFLSQVFIPRIMIPLGASAVFATATIITLIYAKNLIRSRASVTTWEISGLIMFVLFFISYYLFLQPTAMPEGIDPVANPVSLTLNSATAILAFLLVIIAKSPPERFKVILFITSGMFVFALLNTIATLYYVQPPYYSRAYHFAAGIIYNSPGTTILASMLPILLVSFFPIRLTNQINSMMLTVAAVAISAAISLMFSARTFFFVLPAILLFALFRYLVNRRKSEEHELLTIVLFLIASTGILAFVLRDQFSAIIERIVNGTYATKIGHSILYWKQVSTNFFQYPEVASSGEYWFHNFFYDAHRTSGPWTAILAYAFLLLVCTKAFFDVRRRRPFAMETTTLLIAFIPYLMTTIPWESSESQMIALYGALAGMVLTPK